VKLIKVPMKAKSSPWVVNVRWYLSHIHGCNKALKSSLQKLAQWIKVWSLWFMDGLSLCRE